MKIIDEREDRRGIGIDLRCRANAGVTRQGQANQNQYENESADGIK